MELIQLGRATWTRTEDATRRDADDEDGPKVQMFFRGPANYSDFRLDVSWSDVETLISEFLAMKEPKAIALKQAKDLAVGARRVGWIPKT